VVCFGGFGVAPLAAALALGLEATPNSMLQAAGTFFSAGELVPPMVRFVARPNGGRSRDGWPRPPPAVASAFAGIACLSELEPIGVLGSEAQPGVVGPLGLTSLELNQTDGSFGVFEHLPWEHGLGPARSVWSSSPSSPSPSSSRSVSCLLGAETQGAEVCPPPPACRMLPSDTATATGEAEVGEKLAEPLAGPRLKTARFSRFARFASTTAQQSTQGSRDSEGGACPLACPKGRFLAILSRRAAVEQAATAWGPSTVVADADRSTREVIDLRVLRTCQTQTEPPPPPRVAPKRGGGHAGEEAEREEEGGQGEKDVEAARVEAWTDLLRKSQVVLHFTCGAKAKGLKGPPSGDEKDPMTSPHTLFGPGEEGHGCTPPLPSELVPWVLG